MSKLEKTVRSRVSESIPGLTKNKAYKFIKWGFYQGPYFTIINNYGKEISIYDPEKYLFTSDIEGYK